ncbi:conserved hypothetical protein [Gammaproteobacteria bacterium]
MATWVEQLHARVGIIEGQIAAWMAVCHSDSGKSALANIGKTQEEITRPLYDLMQRLYTEELPIARMKDTSDLVIHASGPSADHQAPSLRAISWIASTSKTQLQKLSRAVIPMIGQDAERIASKVEWKFTGYAPGSIFMGFALSRPASPAGFEEADERVFSALSNAARSVSRVPGFVEDERINLGIVEALPDPALRDAAMFAAMNLAPTEKSGLHVLEISSPEWCGELTQRERIVLRDAMKRPLSQRRQGQFIGHLRAVDLDVHRIILRGVEAKGIDTLRCVFDESLRPKLKPSLGNRVKIVGEYEFDNTGKPRLMYISDIREAPAPQNLTMPLS